MSMVALRIGVCKEDVNSKSNIYSKFFFVIQYSLDDEKLVNEARLCNANSKEMVIFDARSVMAASGNKLKVRALHIMFV